jgi:hypothetical protein
MRPLIIPFAIWLGVLQTPVASGHDLTAILTTSSALAGLTVLVYRLGVWRAEMQHTKQNVGAELTRFREESRADFARLELRFSSIDQFIAQATEQRVTSERWQARLDSGFTSLDRRLARIEHHAEVA